MCTVTSDCNKTSPNRLNWLGSSDTVSDSTLNGLSLSDPSELCISLNAFLEMILSVYNVCIISIGRTSFESFAECFCSI